MNLSMINASLCQCKQMKYSTNNQNGWTWWAPVSPLHPLPPSPYSHPTTRTFCTVWAANYYCICHLNGNFEMRDLWLNVRVFAGASACALIWPHMGIMINVSHSQMFVAPNDIGAAAHKSKKKSRRKKRTQWEIYAVTKDKEIFTRQNYTQ